MAFTTSESRSSLMQGFCRGGRFLDRDPMSLLVKYPQVQSQ